MSRVCLEHVVFASFQKGGNSRVIFYQILEAKHSQYASSTALIKILIGYIYMPSSTKIPYFEVPSTKSKGVVHFSV